ncbi:DUF1624 domain-containing protein [Flavihumibacter fluvii]|uniref:DUF1624 domain-containing protein n=1 Tax=Flavihumibacter fluvii TaxID=2838157 RepID=UPI001BDF50C8|nr:heparan-alpha-glucosaminide N-acetyltransferase domain-containing protein [Flavihumibacter fluvii]ULQ51006.1 heparan-alpha-glucosaminide N-acetyltransferase domain-containing protein [Flavihumibacter fluvii]
MPTINKVRIESIDLLRGVVIVLMALDHVRDYFHADQYLFSPEDMTQTNPALFFTRWITHFCAPVFVFLAGTSSSLVGERKTKKELSAFLMKRGLWLIILELTVIGLAWGFNPAFPFFRLQVIWVLGICMVILGVMVYLPPKLILAMGLLILIGHNLLDNIHADGNTFRDFLWGVFHERKRFYFLGRKINTGYPILPWLGIMLLGYSLGQWYNKGIVAKVRREYLLMAGIGAIVLFLVLRGINRYGDMAPWSVQGSAVMTVCSFLNVTKYPPSLLYSLMTLGPALVFLALMEKPLNWLGKILVPFGRVPLFFYILHLYLIHGLAVIAVVLSGRPWTDMVLTGGMNGKDSPWLIGYGFPLAITYAIWILVVLLLYPLCKKYDRYKTNHKEKWWLSYL